jgi:hypothetical protein
MKFDRSDAKRIELEKRIHKAMRKFPLHLQNILYRAFRYTVFCQRRF